MAGFGATLARGLVGGLAGVGNYLKEEGAARTKAAEADTANRRELAMAQFRASLQDDVNANEDTRQQGRIRLTAQENRSNSLAEISARAGADAANDSREFDIWRRKNAITFSTWRQQQNVQLTNDNARTLYTAETQARFAAEKQGLQPAGNDVDAATGARVLYFRNAQGNVSTYNTGVVVQQPQSGLDPATGMAITERPKPTRPARAGWIGDAPSTAGTQTAAGAPPAPSGRGLLPNAAPAQPTANSPNATAPRRDTPGGKIATEADVQETMRRNGMSRTQVMTWMETNGYRMAL